MPSKNKLPPKTKVNFTCGQWDWKEDPGSAIIEAVGLINKLLKQEGIKLKIRTLEDPLCKGSDTYGILFSLDKIPKAQLDAYVKEICGDDEEETGCPVCKI